MRIDYFPTPKRLVKTFQLWLRNTLANEVLLSFLCEEREQYIDDKKAKHRKKFLKKITLGQNLFDEFQFNEKIAMSDIEKNLHLGGFINWFLDKQKLRILERKARFKALEQMLRTAIVNAMSTSRKKTRKLFGFGIYQIDSLASRLETDGSVKSFRPFTIIPTSPLFFELLSKSTRYPNKNLDFVKELISRVSFLKAGWINRKDRAIEEVENLEEVEEILVKWKESLEKKKELLQQQKQKNNSKQEDDRE